MKIIRAFFMALTGQDVIEPHIVNPDHLPDLIETRAIPLVEALESYGASLFASCAGHGESHGSPYWPHFAFRINLGSAHALAAILNNGSDLNYRWSLVGHFMPRHRFSLAFALSIRDIRPFKAADVDADIQKLAFLVSSQIKKAAKNQPRSKQQPEATSIPGWPRNLGTGRVGSISIQSKSADMDHS